MKLTGRIVIAGGSGFLGLNLTRYLLERDCEVVILSRREPLSKGAWTHAKWDARTLGDWSKFLDGATALVNLTGRTVDCIKSPDHCDEILRSRVESTRVLGNALRSVSNPPSVWVQMSTAHRYGDPPELWCDESSAFGQGLAPAVGKAWEEEFESAVLPSMRQVILRTSFVLGQSGGALPRLATLVKWGFGGKVGHGRQGISWIHEQDMNALFVRGITDPAMQGAYLATAPQPVSNADFMAELRKALRKTIGLPAMGWMVKLGAPLLLRTDPELALYGRYCASIRLPQEGFEFAFPNLRQALQDIYGKV